MREAPEAPVEPSEDLLEPDTFWELIEKLLLHSSHDEQKRLRHNVSLSALCRGHALPRLPRDKTQPTTKCSITAKDNKKINVSKALKNNGEKKLLNGTKRALVKNKGRGVNAKQTRSECNVSDSDVVFVKDTEIPASERLWRFAIRNRQQQQDSESNEDEHKPIPSARSNEAIYEGLKKRLEAARKEDHTVIKSKQNRKKEKNKVKKHHCKNKTNNFCFVSNKTENKNSKYLTNPTVALERNSKPSSLKQQASSKLLTHDLRRTPVKNLIETSDADYPHVTPEHFEAKKTLYDTVLKKRLTCGNQLDMLNREIVNKKMNPRMVLSRETTKKYADLKTDYLKLCYQESSLRHQIAMLQAEIYMMQNKNFHKRPAAVKTITLDSKSAQLPQAADIYFTENNTNDYERVLLFPRLKPPKPLILAQQKPEYYVNDRSMQTRKSVPAKEVSISTQKAASEECFSTGFPRLMQNMSPKGVCSLYSLTTSLKPPQKRQPKALLVPDTNVDQMQTTHRLPKMIIPIQTSIQTHL